MSTPQSCPNPSIRCYDGHWEHNASMTKVDHRCEQSGEAGKVGVFCLRSVRLRSAATKLQLLSRHKSSSSGPDKMADSLTSLSQVRMFITPSCIHSTNLPGPLSRFKNQFPIRCKKEMETQSSRKILDP